jgi:hypothetical protein
VARERLQQAWSRLTAIAAVVGAVRAPHYFPESPAGCTDQRNELGVHGAERGFVEKPSRKPRLVRGDRDRKARPGETRDRLDAAGQRQPFVRGPDVLRGIPVDDAVSIKNHE